LVSEMRKILLNYFANNKSEIKWKEVFVACLRLSMNLRKSSKRLFQRSKLGLKHQIDPFSS